MTLPGQYETTFTEEATAPVSVAPASLTVTDVDSGATTVQAARVRIANGYDGAQELLGVTVGASGLTASGVATMSVR